MIYARTPDGKEQAQLECDLMVKKHPEQTWKPIAVNMRGFRDHYPQPYWQPQRIIAKDGPEDRRARRTQYHA